MKKHPELRLSLTGRKGFLLLALLLAALLISGTASANVDDITLRYRPIDVANPFINSAWQKGINWANEEYDFTSTIKAGTWSLGSRNSVYLTKDQISSLKSSTKSNRDQLKY